MLTKVLRLLPHKEAAVKQAACRLLSMCSTALATRKAVGGCAGSGGAAGGGGHRQPPALQLNAITLASEVSIV